MIQKNHVTAWLTLALLLAAGSIFAMGEKENDSAKTAKVEIKGKIRLVGSSPMTSLVISSETREWYIEAREQNKFMHLQQQYVTVRAEEYYHDMYYANGSFAGRYYYLKNISIINPKK
jgi:ABC-type phosphate transport system substrate-binding protein